MPYLMTDTKVERPTCTRITITRDVDPDPDLSWIAARARVLVPMGGSSIVQRVESGGLWGIDYDPETPKDQRDAYLTEIEEEQVAEVREILTAMNVDHEGAEIVRYYSC